ncbi:MAG: hypothetical protein QOI29_5019 [Mycobacterium sp.]|nr:hypothetical protein [Mycobacterium sp.]
MANKLSHLFDIRNVIGALLVIYGVVLTIAGFAPGLLRERDKGASNNPVDLSFGTDANWWVGLALIGVAVVFFAWAWLRPVRVEETPPDVGSTTADADGRSTTDD